MRILMLGWEFPPYITGGLGVACHGLTKALDRQGHEVVFLVPKLARDETPGLVTILASGSRRERAASGPSTEPAASDEPMFERAVLREIPAEMPSPYGRAPLVRNVIAEANARRELSLTAPDGDRAPAAPGTAPPRFPQADRYGGDLLRATSEYAKLVVALARHESFDLVHAHDWPTFTAGIALARVTDRPLVVQIHSTEFDRSGDQINQTVYDLERRGMFAADRVIAVSEMTKGICARHYGVNPGKIDVVYNGIESHGLQPAPGARLESRDRIVLFVGRVTSQKGPEYFLAAAKRVLEKMPGVKFVVAGSGDLAEHMLKLAAELGIQDHVLFTGFLRGPDLEHIFEIADCYVMPSISEPFGIAALEAVQHGVPVIISKQSGVAEVLSHALKVDFWNTEETADKILAVLRRPALARTLREHSAIELSSLTWDSAAEQCAEVYARALREHAQPG